MALSTPRIIGNQLSVTADGSKTIWDTYDIGFTASVADATASDSTLEEGVFTTKRLTGTVTGWLGSVNNGGTLPAVGDTISDLAIAVGSDTILPSLTAYTNIKVTAINYTGNKDPNKWSFTFQSGMLN